MSKKKSNQNLKSNKSPLKKKEDQDEIDNNAH